jgi:hypothetical protein
MQKAMHLRALSQGGNQAEGARAAQLSDKMRSGQCKGAIVACCPHSACLGLLRLADMISDIASIACIAEPMMCLHAGSHLDPTVASSLLGAGAVAGASCAATYDFHAE